MRHLITAAAMVLVALAVTFGTASVLQGVGMARNASASEEPFVVEAARPSAKPVAAKERTTFQSRDQTRSATVGL